MSRAFGMGHRSTRHNQVVIFLVRLLTLRDYFDFLTLPILG